MEGEKRSFLIVDDNELVNRMMTNYLRRMGHLCESLVDSSKVMSWLEINPCNAVVLDLKMPGLDGMMLIKMIREKYPSLPIVVFTGAGYDEQKMKEARELGANGYVSKTLPPDEIYGALMRVFQRHHVTKTGQVHL
jgi:two-component system response regulator (stage 0 sporulation protein F)